MLLLRTDTALGAKKPDLSLLESSLGRQRLRIAGEPAEPLVSRDQILSALESEEIEKFRPLLPVGYEATAAAYRKTAGSVSVNDLTDHYTDGMDWFHCEFIPQLKLTLEKLTGGAWNLDDYIGYAGSGDVDLMTHIVDAAASESKVCLYPGDWYGFLVGSSQQKNIDFDTDSRGSMACLCIPSVRNGHVSAQMLEFLDQADSALLNINLFPTLAAEERQQMAEALAPQLEKSILSVSFSRGFGLTASQLGVILVHRDHPMRKKYETQWNWFSYFYNQIAAKTFLELDLESIQRVDEKRRHATVDWLKAHDLPVVDSGSYYVKSFQLVDDAPDRLKPLLRGDLLRLCFKPVDL